MEGMIPLSFCFYALNLVPLPPSSLAHPSTPAAFSRFFLLFFFFSSLSLSLSLSLFLFLFLLPILLIDGESVWISRVGIFSRRRNLPPLLVPSPSSLRNLSIHSSIINFLINICIWYWAPTQQYVYWRVSSSTPPHAAFNVGWIFVVKLRNHQPEFDSIFFFFLSLIFVLLRKIGLQHNTNGILERNGGQLLAVHLLLGFIEILCDSFAVSFQCCSF